MQLKAKMKIKCTATQAYDAFVNPEKIGNFWFDSSSCKWETGAKPTLTHKQYDVEFAIEIIRAVPNEKIEFGWGGDKRIVTINFSTQGDHTIVECIESGWVDNGNLMADMLKNQTGWVCMLTCLKAYLENGVNTLRTGLLVD